MPLPSEIRSDIVGRARFFKNQNLQGNRAISQARMEVIGDDSVRRPEQAATEARLRLDVKSRHLQPRQTRLDFFERKSGDISRQNMHTRFPKGAEQAGVGRHYFTAGNSLPSA